MVEFVPQDVRGFRDSQVAEVGGMGLAQFNALNRLDQILERPGIWPPGSDQSYRICQDLRTALRNDIAARQASCAQLHDGLNYALRNYPNTDQAAAKQIGSYSPAGEMRSEPPFTPVSPCVDEPIGQQADPQREFLARAQQNPDLAPLAQNVVSPVPFREAIKQCEKLEQYQPTTESSDGLQKVRWGGNDAQAATSFTSSDITARTEPTQQKTAELKKLLGAYESQQSDLSNFLQHFIGHAAWVAGLFAFTGFTLHKLFGEGSKLNQCFKNIAIYSDTNSIFGPIKNPEYYDKIAKNMKFAGRLGAGSFGILAGAAVALGIFNYFNKGVSAP